MKSHRIGSFAAAIACVGMAMPTSAMAATPAAPAVNSDVALRTGGLLVGQVVDQQGVAKAGMPVSVQFAGKEVVSTTTDANGVFAAKGLRGGQYQLITPQGGSDCRLWAADTAPPSARSAAMVVSGNDVVRGQNPAGAWIGWMKAHPYITAGTVVTAIAVPFAFVSNDDDNGS